MRQELIVAAAAAALFVSAGFKTQPVQAASQAASQAGELAPIQLAQNSNGNMFSLLQDIQKLREQVRRLRGEVETLKYQIKRNQDSRQRMYQQLDERLTALEGGSGAGTGAANEADASSAYDAAFEQLRNGKYDDAISGFEAFVKQYPNNKHTVDALYWLGQARYVQGDLSGASSALQQMIDQYPKSDKVASALLRIGVIQQTVGKSKQAKATFQRIVENYPDSDSADKARQQLQ